jgi:Amyotrophic lateral sclerosis 2 chromosomal region candidate gene 8
LFPVNFHCGDIAHLLRLNKFLSMYFFHGDNFAAGFCPISFYVQAADLKMAIDDRVLRHINEMVDCGVSGVAELQRHVAIFVKSLFNDSVLPKSTNRRFYPSRSDLTHLMYRRRKANAQGLHDQDIVQLKITDWLDKYPCDVWLYRQSSDNSDGRSGSNVAGQRLLILHQATWQQRLLLRYGQDMVYLNAPFKNIRHTHALYVLYISSNNGQVAVGAVITERADGASLTEALEVMKTSNPDWMPRGFMVDESDFQISAIKSVFPSEDASFIENRLWMILAVIL